MSDAFFFLWDGVLQAYLKKPWLLLTTIPLALLFYLGIPLAIAYLPQSAGMTYSCICCPGYLLYGAVLVWIGWRNK